jgi:hypothetical protein
MKTYYITVEGIVSRVIRLEAKNVADAMADAKQEFTNLLGADSAQVITINEEKTND